MKKQFKLWLAVCLVLLLGISVSVPAKSCLLYTSDAADERG